MKRFPGMPRRGRSWTIAIAAALLMLMIVLFTPPVQAITGSNGKVLFQSDRDGNWEIYSMNSNGAAQMNLTNNPAFDSFPSGSPDGNTIAFVSDRDTVPPADGNDEIYSMNSDGSSQARLTNNLATDTYPAWSPDGTKIAFTSDRDGNEEIYVMDANGANQVRLTNNTDQDRKPAWSPDGTKIAFTRITGGNMEVFTMNANGSGQSNLTGAAGAPSNFNPSWSPDGTRITFTSNRNISNWEIYVVASDGSGSQTNLTNNAALIDDMSAWSPDGTKIAFHSNRDGQSEVYSMNANGTAQTNLTNAASQELDPSWLPQISSYWTWYDNIYGDNWILMADPESSPGSVTYQVSVAGVPQDLSAYGNGVVGIGQTITPRYNGLMGGPVQVTHKVGAPAILSQRSLWPKGGDSMEEVLGTAEGRLSSHFWWTWYDQLSPGYTNWVLVSNPGATPVYYEITIGGSDPGAGSKGIIAPSLSATPTFPGVMGGPVEVKAWTDEFKTQTADVMASQRVLSSGGAAFNEVPGIPDEELSDHYYWTWYDMTGDAQDWVLIANPNGAAITYEIRVAGALQQSGTIGPGQRVTPTFPGLIGGPVEVTTRDSLLGTPAKSIVTQRSVFGPSLEEVPGWPAATGGSGLYGSLASTYNWTWYDQAEGPGVKNWVLIANPSAVATAHVHIGFTDKTTGVPQGGDYVLTPGERSTPTFPDAMGGPVRVSSDIPIISSQRVLWNGYFNEVLGTVLS